MRKLLFITLSALITLLSACANKAVIGPSAPSVASSSNSYQPLTTGSVWKYVNRVSGATDEQIMVRSTGALSIINYQPYYAVSSASSANGIATNYYFSNGVNYAIRGTSTVPGAVIELQYLDTSLPVGQKWITKINDTGIINGTPGRFEGSIVEKDITKIVGGFTFLNVIHTTVNLQYANTTGNEFTTAATYDYYLAKGIGLIEVDRSVAGVVTGRETITSYDVK